METLQGEILTVIFEFSLDSSNCWLSIILTCKRWELVAFQCILKNSFRKLIENVI